MAAYSPTSYSGQRAQAMRSRYQRLMNPASMQQLYGASPATSQTVPTSLGASTASTATAPAASGSPGTMSPQLQQLMPLLQLFAQARSGGSPSAPSPTGGSTGSGPTPWQIAQNGGYSPADPRAQSPTMPAQIGPPTTNAYGEPYLTPSFGAAAAPATTRLGAAADPRADYIRSLYTNLLGRAPDAAGLQTQINSGLSGDQLTQNFLNSAEYKGLHPTATAAAPVPAPGDPSWMTDPQATAAPPYARGGKVRGQGHGRGHAYQVQGGGTGRSDSVPTRLKPGSYVLPADVVAARGDGSAGAGAAAYGAQPASGGAIAMAMGGGMPARLSRDEVVLDPVAARRRGGAGALDREVRGTRGGWRKKLAGLAPPR